MTVKVTKDKPLKFKPIRVEFTIENQTEYAAWLSAKKNCKEDVYFLNHETSEAPSPYSKKGNTVNDDFSTIMEQLTKQL